jgi:hypothetical protein
MSETRLVRCTKAGKTGVVRHSDQFIPGGLCNWKVNSPTTRAATRRTKSASSCDMEASLLRLAVSFCPVSRPRVAPPNGKQRRIPLRTLSCTGRLTGLGPRLARPVGIWNTWVNVCPGNKTGATPAKRGGGAQVQPWAALERPVRRGPRPHAMRVLPPKPVDHHGRRSSARRTRVRDELEQSTRGVAQSGLARLTGGQKVAGSNPVAPIRKAGRSNKLRPAFLIPRWWRATDCCRLCSQPGSGPRVFQANHPPRLSMPPFFLLLFRFPFLLLLFPESLAQVVCIDIDVVTHRRLDIVVSHHGLEIRRH